MQKVLKCDAAMRRIGVGTEGTEGLERPRLLMPEMAAWDRVGQLGSLAVARTAHFTRALGYFLD